mmetsp:Transcript_68648/g.183222  ORF Transcript_68648/g.183222 Transcript_68648/m.183222 type:complete len:240 (-) Transcript_68648:673-1392(-)
MGCVCCVVTSKKMASVVVGSSVHIFHADVPPCPISVSATLADLRPSPAQQPMAPATLNSRDVMTSVSAPNAMRRWSPPSSRAKTRLSDSLKMTLVKVSVCTMRPPVFSTHAFISATPHWSSAHAKMSTAWPLATDRCASPPKKAVARFQCLAPSWSMSVWPRMGSSFSTLTTWPGPSVQGPARKSMTRAGWPTQQHSSRPVATASAAPVQRKGRCSTLTGHGSCSRPSMSEVRVNSQSP